MSRRDESFGERWRKFSLLQWGLLCFAGVGVSSAAMLALRPAASRAEAAGRATAQLLIVITGVVLIALHFFRRRNGGPKAAARTQAADKNRPRPLSGARPGAPPRRLRRKGL